MPTTAAVAAKTVIVANDTAFVRDRFRTALQSVGHRVSTAGNASELLSLVRSDGAQTDLVVLDLRLPQAEGVALIRSLLGMDGFRAPIVIFSGTIANADEVRELSALGVAGYINEYSAVQHIVPALLPYLQPDDRNRRSSPRVALGIPVAHRFGNTIAAALTLNISRGGLAIRTTNPLAAGTMLKIRFRPPGARRDLEAEAIVAWTDPGVGMGLQFTRLEPIDQAGLDDFVRSHFFSNRNA